MAVTVIYDGGQADSVFDSTVDGGDAFTVFPVAGPTLIPVLDASPVPNVKVLIEDVNSATAVVNLYRLADGRTTLVRGGIRKAAVGGTSVADWEAPFGVPITYRAEMFSDVDATQSLGFTSSSETFLDVRQAWFHQPLNPTQAFSPTMLWGTALERKRSTPGELVYAQGAEVGTWVGGQRQGLADVAFQLLTDRDGADRMQSVFGQYGSSQSPVLCIRTPAAMRIPRTFFAVVVDVTESTLNRPGAGEAVQFDFTATEARPPAPGLVAATLRRDDIDVTYPTRQQRANAYATRLARDSDYTLAGVAGDA
jgi:hypothetical protein